MIVQRHRRSLMEYAEAEFSPCLQFRYSLVIRWDCVTPWDPCPPRLNFLMLNPSTADAFKNDPTVAKCVRLARRWLYGSAVVSNVFAFRATDPRVLYERAAQGQEIAGKGNDEAILKAARASKRTICAWGTHGKLNGRSRDVLAMLKAEGVRCYSLRRTKLGEPGHPLYVPEAVTPRAILWGRAG